MKNYILIALLPLVMWACSTGNAENAENPDKKASQERIVRVNTKEMSPEHFEHFIEATGAIEAIQSAFISPEMAGQIKSIPVREGQRVSHGQLLVVLNSAVLEASIEEVKTGLELATTTYNKQKQLWDKGIGSEIQYLQAKNGKESLESKLKSLESQLAMSRIVAPFSGIVDEIFSKVGEMGNPGVQLINLVNLSELKVNADVSETYLAQINPNDEVTVSFPAFPDYTVKSVISRTGNVIHPNNRTFNVEVRIKNPGEKLKPNLVAVIRLKDFETDSAFLLPSKVIQQDAKGYYVYVADDNGGKPVARKTYVTTGLSDSERTMILSGLNTGDRVVTEGFNTVKAGMRIELAM